MLTLYSNNRYRDCDRLLRRNFLKVGALGFGAFGFAELLAQRAAARGAGKIPKDTSVVWLWLQGGLSHHESFDPKADIPSEYRSVAGEIATAMPGVAFGGHIPKMAKVADRMAVVRSFSHTQLNHSAASHYVMTGHDNGVLDNSQGPQTRPSFGSIASRVRGATHPKTGVPTYVGLVRPIEYDGGAFLGAAYNPFRSDGQAMRDMQLRTSLDRLADRRRLLADLDRLRREIDESGQFDAIDAYQRQAASVVLRGAAKAFDLSGEDPGVVARYGEGLPKQLLLARRLCEAGCGFVSIRDGSWDFHGPTQNGTIRDGMARRAPPLDHAVATFIEDVHQRGLQDKILLVVTGDFGRSPKINDVGGRDHWPYVSTLALAGGGLKMGQVIGASDKMGAYPTTKPIHPQDLMATLFHVLGMDLETQVVDLSGRPVKLVESGRPIHALI